MVDWISSFSPLFIGEDSSITCGKRHGYCDEVSFSPLFIGEDSSIARRATRSCRCFCFQSPLHRGILFNAFRWKCWRHSLYLSVPSSSGKTLQCPGCGRLPGGVVAFSPLFIGEDSSISTTTYFPEVKIGFQSPLHRGRLFNAFSTVGKNRGELNFQSPLHRGRLFNLNPT